MQTNSPIHDTNNTLAGFKHFAALVYNIGTTTKTNEKLTALQEYFLNATDQDKLWVIAIFSGRRPKRTVTTAQLKEWCIELTGLTNWLFDECYHTVGDLAETIALLTENTEEHTLSLNNWSLAEYILQLMSLQKKEDALKKAFIIECWKSMQQQEKFVFNKLITGGFRIGVSQKIMINALAKTLQLEESTVAHKISGNWNPAEIKLQDLMNSNTIDFSKPYTFYLAYALDKLLDNLGEEQDWQAEWKWDGIRGQIIKRNNELFVWSRGEELMTNKFPEFTVLQNLLPNGVALDGEIIPMKNNQPLPFALMQTRIGRKTITKKQLTEVPIHFLVYDIVEFEHTDCRHLPLIERRNLLEQIVHQTNNAVLQISPTISFTHWHELSKLRKKSRNYFAEGIMLKKKSSTYQVGRKVGDWWKWKIDPLTIDAVLIYAQKGHGRRSNLYTDYTFAVKDGDKLVSFTKAYSGLTDKELIEVDAFVKKNAIEKFGPVRTVKPILVFEIAFEGIAASNRHKSGVALRFPRIARWRKDKPPTEINTVEDLKKLLHQLSL